MNRERIIGNVDRYYSERVREFGPTPRGVDWNSEESQTLRFAQLARLFGGGRYSLVDFGCGYGALVDYLEVRGDVFDYQGFDISAEMVGKASELHKGRRFTSDEGELVPADFAVASGVFNVKLDTDDGEWTDYVDQTLGTLDRLGRGGFAFNMLTSYSDSDRMRSDLFYGDPRRYFDLCKRRFSKQVALLHDYGLWEFTMLVRK